MNQRQQSIKAMLDHYDDPVKCILRLIDLMAEVDDDELDCLIIKAMDEEL